MTSSDNEQFTLANLPLGAAVQRGSGFNAGIVTRLYDSVYFLSSLHHEGLLRGLSAEIEAAIRKSTLNELAALGRSQHRKLREELRVCLANSSDEHLARCRIKNAEAVMKMPVEVGDFSDFSCSVDHALNAGEAVIGVRSLPPGFLHFPIGYGGRSSSIAVSGTDVRRPNGHFKKDGGVAFGPSRAVDFELEVACIIGRPTNGQPVTAEDAGEHIFGFVLLNDWSARDIQTLEMTPLGPFNGKSFGTTISPWVVMADALEPFLLPVPPRQQPVANHFTKDGDRAHYNIALTVDIEAAGNVSRACTSRLDSIYWTMRDMIAHQTCNGCAVRPGDMLATGTVSGTKSGTYGCLLEITKGSKEKFVLKDGAERTYLEDGDQVTMKGWAGDLGKEDCVGFGECSAVLRPALRTR